MKQLCPTLAFLFSIWSCVVCEVVVLRQLQVIYDSSPKIRIRGSGFDAGDHDILLDIGATGNPLVVDKDYAISKDDDGIILKLMTNRKWIDLAGCVPPVPLILSAVKFRSNPETNLLAEPVYVAQVLARPTIVSADWVLYQTASNELRINGTGFIGAKKVAFYFQPPLLKDVAYEDVTPYPLSKNQVVLRLRHGYSWREEVGPLMVIGLDTGGGPVKINGDDGVEVANVVSDQSQGPASLLSVEDTASTQFVYDDDSTIVVRGSGFNEVGNLLRWSNGLLGNNVNYTTISTTKSAIQIRLTPGSHWRKNFENLPGALTLLAVNAGGGYVAVGSMNSGKGRDVAMVFERPAVYSNNAKIFRTQSHELHVKGTGFPPLTSGFSPQLRFDHDLMQGEDFTIRVVDRTEIEITLVDGSAWRDDAGPLVVTHVNTRGDEAGWVQMPGGGVHIAEVQADLSITVQRREARVYQSAQMQGIEIHGQGFSPDILLVLDPPLGQGVDFTVEYVRTDELLLKLRSGRKWRGSAGPLFVKQVTVEGRNHSVRQEDARGVLVATVLADPHVNSSTSLIHNSQTKEVTIYGHGFSRSLLDTKLLLRPVGPADYKIVAVLENLIRVRLQLGRTWAPVFMTPTFDNRVPLQVYEVNTGAGTVLFDTPITIGYIIKDREGVVCDDSCEFAFDGVCDDGSEPNQGYGDETHSWGVPPCLANTDCTDCGGVDEIDIPSSGSSGGSTSTAPTKAGCTNTCQYAHDGVCDDPRGTGQCEIGTDCEDCELPLVTKLENTALSQHVYNTAPTIKVTGVVAHTTAAQFLIWSNAALTNKVAYEMNPAQRSITVRRNSASAWIEDTKSLPAVLSVKGYRESSNSATTLLSVPVATVFETPSVYANFAPLHSTQSRELHIRGAGFPVYTGEYHFSLRFSPPLQEGLDYSIRLVSRTDLFLILHDGRAWRTTPGRLSVIAVNTLGESTDDGWLSQPSRDRDGAGDSAGDGDSTGHTATDDDDFLTVPGVCVAQVYQAATATTVDTPSTRTSSSSPLSAVAMGALIVGVLAPIVILIFCLVSAAFHWKQQVQKAISAPPVGLSEKEFEMTRTNPMLVTATEVIFCADQQPAVAVAGSAEDAATYMLIPDQNDEV